MYLVGHSALDTQHSAQKVSYSLIPYPLLCLETEVVHRVGIEQWGAKPPTRGG